MSNPPSLLEELRVQYEAARKSSRRWRAGIRIHREVSACASSNGTREANSAKPRPHEPPVVR